MLRRGLESLADILGSDASETKPRSGDLFSSNVPGATRRHDTYRVESPDGPTLPSVIAPALGDMDDFFATVSTYYNEYSPISAVVHILSEETRGLLDHAAEASITSFRTQRRSNRIAAIGAAIGEATLTSLEANDTGGSLSYAVCKRTLAYSLCRASLLYGSELQADAVADRWKRLRKMTGLTVSPAASDAVVFAHTLGSGIIDSHNKFPANRELSEALRDPVIGDNGNDRVILNTLADLYPAIKQHLDNLHGPFDGRMAAFTRLVEVINSSSRGPQTDEIAIGFACNRIQPGSFAHFAVLTKLVSFFPAALVWYGFFAARSRSSATHQMSPNLTAKLERDLLESFSFEQRPRCDISLEELETLSRAPLRPEIINPSQPRALLVALLPGIDIYSRFGSEGETVGDRVRRDSETDELHKRAVMLLEEALFTLKRAVKKDLPGPTSRKQRRGD